MDTAPKDGSKIRVLCLSGQSRRFSVPHLREIPYRIVWHEGRWCYARHKTPVFEWHQPKFWRLADDGLDRNPAEKPKEVYRARPILSLVGAP